MTYITAAQVEDEVIGLVAATNENHTQRLLFDLTPHDSQGANNRVEDGSTAVDLQACVDADTFSCG